MNFFLVTKALNDYEQAELMRKNQKYSDDSANKNNNNNNQKQQASSKESSQEKDLNDYVLVFKKSAKETNQESNKKNYSNSEFDKNLKKNIFFIYLSTGSNNTIE